MIKKNWTAVIPAAGKSKRFNYKQSKIFYKYKKKFLIEHSVDKIKKHISKVLIVANHSNKKKLKKLFFKDKNIKIVTQKKNLEWHPLLSLHLIILKQNFLHIMGRSVGNDFFNDTKSYNEAFKK